MSLSDTVNYIIFTNPVSTQVGQLIKKTGLIQPKVDQPAVRIYEYEPLHKLAKNSGGPVVKIAGLFGASAVILGAYGAHKKYPEEDEGELRRVFDTANRFHFIHSLALLGTPLCKRPALSASFFSLGMILFCGTCYYTSFTGNRPPRYLSKLAPAGGMCFIIGWLSMAI